MTAIRPHRVRRVVRGSTHLATRRRALTAPLGVLTLTGMLRRSVQHVTMVSTHLWDRLSVLSVSRTRWTMTRIRRHHVWPVRLATCHWRGRSHALRVVLERCTTCPRAWGCAQRVRWVSIRMWRLRAHVSLAMLVSMRTLMVRAAAVLAAAIQIAAGANECFTIRRTFAEVAGRAGCHTVRIEALGRHTMFLPSTWQEKH